MVDSCILQKVFGSRHHQEAEHCTDRQGFQDAFLDQLSVQIQALAFRDIVLVGSFMENIGAGNWVGFGFGFGIEIGAIVPVRVSEEIGIGHVVLERVELRGEVIFENSL